MSEKYGTNKNKIVVCVEGGMVQSVYGSPGLDVELEVFDIDVLKESDEYTDSGTIGPDLAKAIEELVELY